MLANILVVVFIVAVLALTIGLVARQTEAHQRQERFPLAPGDASGPVWPSGGT